tara:strand:+ start:632 stop:862 length:231 start_codon:yes stop_codon:yes gene_type:complete
MIKNLMYYLYYNTKLVLSYMGDALKEFVPPQPPPRPIELDDDPYEIEDSMYEPSDDVRNGIGDRNEWGLPIIEEEE